MSARTNIVRRLLRLALLALPVMVRAQFFIAISQNQITITGYTGWDSVLTIPDNIRGVPVTAIAEHAFDRHLSLTSVIIPDSVVAIGAGAFNYCNLTSVTIGSGVTTIGSGAFGNCLDLRSITVAASNPSFVTVDGILFNRALTRLIQSPANFKGDFTIPNGVTTIDAGAFNQRFTLTGVTIPDSVTTIGESAFGFCEGLTSVRIGSGLTTIRNRAFEGCNALTNLTIGNGLTSIGDFAFWDCSSLTTVTLPDSVIDIGTYAFNHCFRLKAVNFRGNAPHAGTDSFTALAPATLYYLPGTTGWGATLGGGVTAVWALPDPVFLTGRQRFGVQADGFGFVISWATNLPVVVEATTDPAQPAWKPVSTNTLIGGTATFSDPHWQDYPNRSYRLRTL